MSKIDYFSAATSVPGPPTARPSRRPLPRLVPVVAVLVVAVAAGCAFLLLRSGPIDHRPVVLPDALAGYAVADPGLQFSQAADWRAGMREDFGDRPWDGRAYGGVPGPLIHLVVVRGDSDKKGSLTTVREPFTKIGDVTCTQTFQTVALPGQSESGPKRMDRWAQCWRSDDSLTVSVLVVLTTPQFVPTAAAAVEEAWALQE